MITVDIVRRSFQAIVQQLKLDVGWHSVWTNPLDVADQCYPVCWWGPLSGSVPDVNGTAPNDTFNVDMMFVDQTSSDRGPDERDAAHDRMDAVARMVWRKWSNDYMLNTGEFDGILMDFVIGAEPQLTPTYDDGNSLTGVRLTVSLTAVSRETCLTDYFSA